MYLCFMDWYYMCLCLVHYKGEEEENNEDEEEEDAGWMVPHGYLSEGEGCEDDEEVCGSRKNMCDIVHPTKINSENASDLIV